MQKTLFIGDSILDWFNNSKYFPDIRIINKGIAGDTIDGVLYRFTDTLKNNSFDRVFIMVGHNDLIMGRGILQCVSEYRKILEIAEAQSGLKVYSVGLLPIDFISGGIVKDFNSKIKEISESLGFYFVEVYKYFVLENKKANPAYSDGLHLTACGYDVLADIFLKVFTG